MFEIGDSMATPFLAGIFYLEMWNCFVRELISWNLVFDEFSESNYFLACKEFCDN